MSKYHIVAAQMYNGPGPSQTEEHISIHMAKSKKKTTTLFCFLLISLNAGYYCMLFLSSVDTLDADQTDLGPYYL